MPVDRSGVFPRVLLVLALACVALGSGQPVAAAAQPADVVFRGPATSRTIALTFDDGWDPERCQAIYEILVRHGVPATWFPNAVHVRTSPSLWRRIAARFPIANHTARHPSLTRLKAGEIRREIQANERIIEEITGRPMSRILRPPYGAYDGRVLRQARRVGYDIVAIWDVSSGDTSTRSSDRDVARHAMRGRAGSVILMHCGPAVTPRILPIVIARYACLGFRFATLEGLLAGRSGVKARVGCPPPPLPPEPRRPRRTRPDARPTGERAPGVELIGRDWRLIAAAGNDVLEPISPPDLFTIRFGRRMASGTIGCDRFAVMLSYDGKDALTFGRVVRSDDDCPDQAAGRDEHLDTLTSMTTYRVRGDELTLLDADGRARLRFGPSEPVDVVGDWTVTALSDGEGILLSPDAATPVTATFTATGTIRGSTGCDTFVGGYSHRPDAIAIGPLLAGPAACDAVLDDQHRRALDALRAAEAWRIRGTTLELRDADSRLLLMLVPRSAADAP